MTVESASSVFVDPQAYADPDRFLAACTFLRREAPVVWVEHEDYRPFWALIRHADIVGVLRDSELFRSAPRTTLMPKKFESARTGLATSFIQMDGPQHTVHRRIVADWFTPRAMRNLEHDVTTLAEHFVDRWPASAGNATS